VAQEENIIIEYLINSVNLFFVFSNTQKERNRQPLFSYTRNTLPVVFFTFVTINGEHEKNDSLTGHRIDSGCGINP